MVYASLMFSELVPGSPVGEKVSGPGADLAELAWERYDKVTIQASVPGADGQQLGAGAEEQLDNRPDPRAREAYAFFQHGATETAGGCVDGWGG